MSDNDLGDGLSTRPDTSAQGFFTYAEAYAASARVLVSEGPDIAHREAPARMLPFHAIELYLKSFLRCVGRSTDELAVKPLAHDLGALSKAAQGHLGLAADDLLLLADHRLSSSAMQTRYLAPTARNKLLVEPALLCAVASRVRSAVLDHPARKGQIIFFGEGSTA